MGKVIQFEAMPKAAMGRSVLAKIGSCSHNRLTFINKRVECQDCGKEWRDFLGECKK